MNRRLISLLVAWLFTWTAAIGLRAAEPAENRPVILVMIKAAPDHFRPDQSYGGGYGDQLGASARTRIARRIAARHGLTVMTNWPMPLLGVDCFVMEAPAGKDPEALAAEISRERGVAWSQPEHQFRAQSTPAGYDDPLYPAEPAARLWHLAELHRAATGRGVSVAVIDSSVDSQHPDLAGQITTRQDFSGRPLDPPESHGTGVAGIIAARAGNKAGTVGVAPDARLMALRACWQKDARDTATICDSFSLARALQFAVEHRAAIINMSLSGPRDILLERLIAIGVARGSSVVAAVDPAAADGGFPASLPGVIAVADRGIGGLHYPVYVAPGRDIPTTTPGATWSIVNGSSYAAAHVTGLLALMREGRPTGAPTLLPAAASGPINACLTLTRARRADECLCATGC